MRPYAGTGGNGPTSTRGRLQKIEAGDIAILVSTLVRLREALGCDWKRLLGA